MPRKGAVLVSCAPGSGHAARVRVTQESLSSGRLHLLSLVCRTRTLQDCSDRVLAEPDMAADQSAEMTSAGRATTIFACGSSEHDTEGPLIGQGQAKARLNAAQTARCALIASSTAGTMPKKAWIIPGYSLYSTETPARRNASA